MIPINRKQTKQRSSTIHGFRFKENHVFAMRAESGLPEEVILVECQECSTTFAVCRRCWRGQAYCSPDCRKSGTNRNHRQAQRRYRQTENGKEVHRQYEQGRRRIGCAADETAETESGRVETTEAPSRAIAVSQKNRDPRPKNTMADVTTSNRVQGSKLDGWAGPLVTREAKCAEEWVTCRFCGGKGLVVKRFKRRGYYRKKITIG